MYIPFVDQISHFMKWYIDGLTVSMIVEFLTTARFMIFLKMADCRVTCSLTVGPPVADNLLTPLLSPEGPHETAYNASHIKTRNCTEGEFEVLKRCFYCDGATLRIYMITSKSIIRAAMVPHNKTIMTNLNMEKVHIDAGIDDDVGINNVGKHDNVIL